MVNQFGQHIPDYPGQQPHQDQAYMRYWAQQNQRYQQPQAQSQQPTSRMAEVFLAANEKAVYDFPVAAGTTVLFVAGDESFIAIKEPEQRLRLWLWWLLSQELDFYGAGSLPSRIDKEK